MWFEKRDVVEQGRKLSIGSNNGNPLLYITVRFCVVNFKMNNLDISELFWFDFL